MVHQLIVKKNSILWHQCRDIVLKKFVWSNSICISTPQSNPQLYPIPFQFSLCDSSSKRSKREPAKQWARATIQLFDRTNQLGEPIKNKILGNISNLILPPETAASLTLRSELRCWRRRWRLDRIAQGTVIRTQLEIHNIYPQPLHLWRLLERSRNKDIRFPEVLQYNNNNDKKNLGVKNIFCTQVVAVSSASAVRISGLPLSKQLFPRELSPSDPG